MREHPEQQRVRAALQRVWRQVEPDMHRRLTTLEETGKALASGSMDDERRQQAIEAAHKLAGSMGMFGFAAASACAGEIEHLLETSASIGREQFNEVLERLRLEMSHDRNE